MQDGTAQPAVEVRHISKRFPGVQALDDVSIAILPGEIHALVGENGAGKSTLVHILAGAYAPDAGEIRIGDRVVQFHNGHEAIAAGISTVFQELSLVGNLSVAENVFANRQPTRGGGLIDWPTLRDQTRKLIDSFGEQIAPTTLVSDLSPAQRQAVEILKALSTNPRVLILDEPTSSLSERETEHLHERVRMLRDSGVAIIYISHHLGEVFQLCDRATVLRDGRVTATRNIADLTEAEIVRLMVGRELSDIFGARTAAIPDAPPRFDLRAFSAEGSPPIDLTIRPGEIVGMYGLVGSGRTELARAVFGLSSHVVGEVLIDGNVVPVRDPAAMIDAGIGYLTEDRRGDGLYVTLSVRDNVAAPRLRAFTDRLGMLSSRAIRRAAEQAKDNYHIATPTLDRPVGNLSGGNQQKVLFAAWAGVEPKVLIVDEPTRGVDVGARSEIYHYLRETAARGTAILMISSDVTEILGLSDRILVMRDRGIIAEFAPQDASEERVVGAALGRPSTEVS